MKYYKLIWILVLLLFSCKNLNKQKKVNQEISIRDSVLTSSRVKVKSSKDFEQQQGYDTLSIKSVKFNDKPFLYENLSSIKIKVDSIKTNNWECGNPFGWDGEAFQSKYINGAEYVVRNGSNEGFLIAAFIKKGNFLTLNRNGKKVTLNKDTHVDEIKKMFSNSETVDLEDEYYTSVSFNTQVPENGWRFYYNKKGFLIRFELYWWLC